MSDVMSFRAPAEHPVLFASRSKVFSRVGGDGVCYIPTLNGTSQHYKFAKAVVGNGAGKIVLRGKLSDINETVKLLDGDGLANRLYLNLNDSTDVLSAGTLTVTVNETDNTAIYNEVTEIVVSGDFTGLELATLFARFNGTECAKFQPFFMSYEDQSQEFKYDFTKAAADYFLPEGFEFQRNLVTENNITAWDGTEADWDQLSLGVNVSSATVFLYKAIVTNHVQGKVKLNGNLVDSAWFGGDGVYTGICLSDSVLKGQTGSGSTRFIGTVEFEVWEVPNALILQGASADINNDFEQMVQRADGHWIGKNNLWVDGKTSDIAPLTNINGTFVEEEGEWYSFGKAPENIATTTSAGWGVYANSDYQKLATQAARVRNFSSTETVLSFTPVFKHLIKLSDYLQKQYQIEQIKAAIAAYQAKNKTRNITTLDGVDDHIDGLNLILSDNFEIEWWDSIAGPNAGYDVFGQDASSDNWFRIVNATALPRLKIGGEVVNAAVKFTLDGKLHKRGIALSGNDFLFKEDGLVISTVNAPTAAENTLAIDVFYKSLGGNYVEGNPHNFTIIDHENPLPIDQGGNSGYWPLDDPKGTIASNKLGLDKKGNIVVKDGAGLGSDIIDLVQYHSILVGSADVVGTKVTATSNSTTVRFQFPEGAFPIEQNFIVTVKASVVLDAAVDLCDGALAYIGDGETEILLKRDSAKSNDSVYKFLDFSRLDVGDVIELVGVRAAYGYGKWQGLPSNFSSTEEHTRDSDGAYVGSNLLAFDKVIRPTVQYAGITGFFEAGLEVNKKYRYRIDVTSLPATADLKARTNDSAGLAVDITEATTYVGGFTATNPGFWLQERAANSGSAGAELSVELMEVLPLSPELQRQWDLAIVEKQIEKQLKKVGKSHNVIDSDGLDDSANFLQFIVPGSQDFVVGFWASDDGTTQRIIGRENSSASRVEFVAQRRLRIRCSGVNVDTEIDSIKSDELYCWYEIHRKGSDFLFYESGVLIATVTHATAAQNEFLVDAFLHSNGATYYSGHAGPFLLKSLENPKDSRFYVHNPSGYLEDKLHPDGSMDGTYNGMPADFSNIQSFKKSGDDWVSVDQLTTIPGA